MKLNPKDLQKILDLHKLYLEQDNRGVKADLQDANLQATNLQGADLRCANLQGVNLRGANLQDANLQGADLRDTNLRCANLLRANLRGADLRDANLSSAILRDADLSDTDLFSANLRDADLRGADLHCANLRWVDLFNVNLQGADLSGADLDYSCLPLWCGSLSAHFDDRQLKQIAYHLVKAGLRSKNSSAETKAELRKIIDFANGFHRAQKCGYIVAEEEEKDKSNNFHKGERQ